MKGPVRTAVAGSVALKNEASQRDSGRGGV